MYSSEIDGERVEFGTSGFLYRSNKLMYDRKTNTLWHQFRGLPAVGPLVGSGIQLKVLPMTLTVWSDWVEDHPDTTVLDLDTGIYPEDAYTPESQNDSAYFTYRNRDSTAFPVPERNSALNTKEQVFGLAFGDEARAYPLSIFEGGNVVNDVLGDRNVVIVSAGEGSGIRAYDRGSHTFSLLDTGVGESLLIADEDGREWLAEEDALVNLDGSTQPLERLASRDSYWFGWFAFYPNTTIYTP